MLITFCLFFKSIAWHHSKFTFALYLGLNFFLQVYFYPELCFVLLPAINLLLPYPYFIFPLKVSEVFFPPENFPCEALHVILSVSECSSPKFQKDMDVGLFFTHGIRIPVGLLNFETYCLVLIWGYFLVFSLMISFFHFFVFIFSFSSLLVGCPRLVFISCLSFHLFIPFPLLISA